jgi:hypothetical protein
MINSFMKKSCVFLISLIAATASFSQDSTKRKMKFDKALEVYEVDASCGTCMFHMAGKGCELAINFKGKTYFVEGTSIDDHGDAHEKDGFCNAIRKAKVQGELKGDKFYVTYFELVKVKKE